MRKEDDAKDDERMISVPLFPFSSRGHISYTSGLAVYQWLISVPAACDTV